MIMIRSALLLMLLTCVWTMEYKLYGSDPRYSFWPSVHNALVLRRRDVQGTAGVSEGGPLEIQQTNNSASPSPSPSLAPVLVATGEGTYLEHSPPYQPTQIANASTVMTNESPSNNNGTDINDSPSKASNATLLNTAKQLDLHSPGVLFRSVIVFGGFLILAVLYYIFYKRKGKKNDTSNGHNTLDNNQFRYGFLQSEDRRDNVEFGSRVPLTLESDDDDEDDDLEIFDLGEKKKSLSYVNLGTNDEDIVFPKPVEVSGNDRGNILLDIEDATSDPLINWSNNGNKSIL